MRSTQKIILKREGFNAKKKVEINEIILQNGWIIKFVRIPLSFSVYLKTF